MENFSSLWVDVPCPSCGTASAFSGTQGCLRFVWGAVPSEYRVGDEIRWNAGSCQRLVSGTSVHGDRSIREVIAFECSDDYSLWRCERCTKDFDPPAIRIVANRIESVVLYPEGEASKLFGVDLALDLAAYFDESTGRWTPSR
jgi:hypothetical protein